MFQFSVESDIGPILATPHLSPWWILIYFVLAVSVKSYFLYLVLMKTLSTQCDPTFNSSDSKMCPYISFSLDCLKFSNYANNRFFSVFMKLYLIDKILRSFVVTTSWIPLLMGRNRWEKIVNESRLLVVFWKRLKVQFLWTLWISEYQCIR